MISRERDSTGTRLPLRRRHPLPVLLQHQQQQQHLATSPTKETKAATQLSNENKNDKNHSNVEFRLVPVVGDLRMNERRNAVVLLTFSSSLVSVGGGGSHERQ